MAQKRYRIGVAGLVHDHVWSELAHWRNTGRVDLVAAADPNAPLRDRAQQEFAIASTYETVKAMLDAETLDAIQVCTSNADGVAAVEQAAAKKLHCVVEKPMAATLEGADRMLKAVCDAGVTMLVNWPFRWRPATVQAWRLVEDGVIGHVFHARVRMAHKGPREFGCSDYFCDWLFDAAQNGAGALVDYCSYGAVALRHLFGMPNAVQGVAGRLTKTDIAVDDNAAITLIYDNRHAVTEASWSQIPSYHDAVYLGTEGTLWTHEGKLFIADESRGERELPVDPLPDEELNGPRYFLHCVDHNLEPEDVCSPTICRDAQEILEAGLRSHETGRRIAIPIESKT